LITIATVSVEDVGTAHVLSTVQQLFNASKKFRASRELDPPQQGIEARVRGGYLATGGGETLLVRVISDGEDSTKLEIRGTSYPLFDFGATGRRVRSVVQYLRDRDMSVEVNSMTKHHKLGGPIRIVG
jgi:thiamine pyrophosphokinase